MLKNFYGIGQLSHKALLFTRSEVGCSQPLYLYAKENVSEASAQHEEVRAVGKLSEPNRDDF